MFIGVAEQEMAEMFLNGTADALSRNPFSNGIRLDITQVFERNFLRKTVSPAECLEISV